MPNTGAAAGATSVGDIALNLLFNTNEFQMQLNRIQKLAASAGKMIAGAFAVREIVKFGKECLELGSDLEEVQNVVDVVFGSMSGQIDAFAQKAASQFGLSETMAKRYAGTFGSMANAFGITGQAAVDMSTTLTGLAGDVASFYNISQDQAYTKLKSVFTGETESLKELGVVMTQTALDSYAMANGFGKTTSAMSEAEKVQLRYMFVQSQLANASGDFAKTSDSWANQVRILTLQIQSLKAAIGQSLIALFTPIIQVVNMLLGKLVTLANAFKSFIYLITGRKAKEATDTAKSAATGLAGAADAATGLSDATTGVGKAAKKAVKEMRALMGFDQINKLSEPADTSIDTGSSGAPSGASGLGSAVDFGSLEAGNTVLDDTNKKVEEFAKKVKTALAPAAAAFDRLKQSVSAIGKTAASGLNWILQNVLIPLGKWTISEVLPRFLDTIAVLLDIFNNVLIALQPYWEWFWNNVLKPIAKWAADTFLNFWDFLNDKLGKFSDWCKKNPDIVGGATGAILGFLGSLLFAKGAMDIAVKGVELLMGAIELLSNPIVFACLAIGLLVGVGIWLWKNWDDVSAKLAEIWEGIKAKASEIWEGIKFNIITTWQSIRIWAEKKFGAIRDGLAGIWDSIKTTTQDIWDGIKLNILTTWQSLRTWAETKFGAIRDGLAGIWENIQTKIDEVWGFISETLPETWENIKASAVEKFEAIRDGIAEVWDNVTTKAGQVWFFLFNTLKDTWSRLKDGAVEKFEEIRDKIAGVWRTIWLNTVGKWLLIKESVVGKLQAIWDKAVEVGTGIKDSLAAAFEGFVDLVKIPINGVIGLLNSLIRWVNVLLAKIESVLSFNFTIPNPFGGNLVDYHWSATLPRIKGEIPELANGAYVAANTPQLAMIGDNKHEGEFVAPESKLMAMAKAAAEMAGGGNSELLIEILQLLRSMNIVALDEESMRKYFVRKTNANTRATGKCEIVT